VGAVIVAPTDSPAIPANLIKITEANMAHELDTRADGTAAVFSLRKTPWHREGTVLRDAPSLEEALRVGGLDFQVDVRPLFVRSQPVPDVPIFTYDPAENAAATVRTDRGTVLGVITERYQPLQNRDAFGVLEPLLDAGLASLETGGALRGGRDVWMLVRFNVESPIVQEVFADEVIPFGLISNNHAGQRKVVVQETPIRVVCANTLSLALGDRSRALGVRHTASVELKTVEAARQLWSSLIERYETAARQYQALKARHIDTALFRRLVLDVASPVPPELQRGSLTPRQEAARSRVVARRMRVTQLWTEGTGHSGDRSMWEAYNAVAESIDHDGDLWRVRGSRTAALMDGRLGDIKSRVLATLVSAATSAN
jgi:phage/plasmid-like protein (TIGR03299 family)